VLLIDIGRAIDADGNVSLLAQTRRHAAIVKLIGVKHVAVAINKLDLINFDAKKFLAVSDAFSKLAQELGIDSYTIFPISALAGDNVVEASTQTPWYQGPSLLQWLEALDIEVDDSTTAPFSLAVQWVIRANGSSSESVRRVAGRIGSGSVKVGDVLTLLPSAQSATVKGLYLGEKSLQEAHAGQSIAIEFVTDVDVARGDWLTRGNTETSATTDDAQTRNRIDADLCWLDSAPLSPTTPYWIKHGTQLSRAKVVAVDNRLDLATAQRITSDDITLKANDIGHVQIASQRALWFGGHGGPIAERGRFVLIDPASNRTVAAGLVR
jgi:sulfate adenylyltransferase subunit 1